MNTQRGPYCGIGGDGVGLLSKLDVKSLSPKGRAVLKSARQLFERQGYDGSPVRQIAAHAGCTKATLYAIFGDKLGLFHSVVGTLAAKLPSPASVIAGSSWRVDIRFCAIAWRLARLELGRDFQAINRLLALPMQQAEVDPFPIWREIFDPYRAAVVVAIADAKKRGYMRVDCPELAASQFMCLVRGGLSRRPGKKELAPWIDSELKKHIDSTTAFFLAAHSVREGQWDHLLYP
ncbi:TetR/AcrR family transcriptional regulator [Stenotrophomonas sp. S41]|uniref:TetR/AcrR family transcriptional regulator n=1 Tax=Stenotrophomonas sp. S41 TaxID=2767464 RepID=UPI00190DBDA3|nr:TetR/AcrR family transcriptional regulator [Stenotrophomonas sp. S41]MBK0010771.1 TetR/AcrR family transcriptional regulator [Stenotrophomonas sp. S41]